MDDIIFVIADQMNHGIDNVECPELRSELATLNEMAGIKARGFYDHMTARSYFKIALKLMPDDHWESCYEQSLRLYNCLAESAYSCGCAEVKGTIQHILDNARCLDDKLDAYHVLTLLSRDADGLLEAYKVISSTLAKLGEELPEHISEEETAELLKTTSTTLRDYCSSNSLLQAGGKVERRSSFVLKVYAHLFTIAFATKAQLVPFVACKIVQLSMKHGSPKYFMIGKSTHVYIPLDVA